MDLIYGFLVGVYTSTLGFTIFGLISLPTWLMVILGILLVLGFFVLKAYQRFTDVREYYKLGKKGVKTAINLYDNLHTTK